MAEMNDWVPEYDPDDAEAERIAEEYADAAEEYDRTGEAWYEQHYQPGDADPAPFSSGALYLMSLMHDYWTGRPLGTLALEAHHGF